MLLLHHSFKISRATSSSLVLFFNEDLDWVIELAELLEGVLIALFIFNMHRTMIKGVLLRHVLGNIMSCNQLYLRQIVACGLQRKLGPRHEVNVFFDAEGGRSKSDCLIFSCGSKYILNRLASLLLGDNECFIIVLQSIWFLIFWAYSKIVPNDILVIVCIFFVDL